MTLRSTCTIFAFPNMKKTFIIRFVVSLLAMSPVLLMAQKVQDIPSIQGAHQVLVPACVDARGDTVPTILLRPFVKYAPERPMTAKQEKYYWKLVRDVRICLPLSKLVATTMIETTEYIRTLSTQEEREKHLRQMERDLIKEYEPVLRKMTYSQGKVLLKLIARECNSSAYQILQAYLGNFAADFWQAVARIFTADLKMEYEPEGKDALIEKIVIKIEQGEL